MAKQKKKRTKKHVGADVSAPTSSLKGQLKRFNWKRLIIITLATLLAFGVYEALAAIPFLPVGGVSVIVPVYFVIVTALLCAILILNSGISPKEITPEMLSRGEDDDTEHLKAVCDKLNARKKIAKRLMLVLLPFLFSILFDVIYLFWGDLFTKLISSSFGS